MPLDTVNKGQNFRGVQHFEVLYQEAVLVDNVTDMSEQFFTPCSSPLMGNRQIELVQTISSNHMEQTPTPVKLKMNSAHSSTSHNIL